MLILDYSSTKKIWGRNFQTSNSLSSQGSRGKQKKNLMFFLEIWKFTTPSILGPFNGRVWTCKAGVQVLKIGTFEGSGFLGHLVFSSTLWFQKKTSPDSQQARRCRPAGRKHRHGGCHCIWWRIVPSLGVSFLEWQTQDKMTKHLMSSKNAKPHPSTSWPGILGWWFFGSDFIFFSSQGRHQLNSCCYWKQINSSTFKDVPSKISHKSLTWMFMSIYANTCLCSMSAKTNLTIAFSPWLWRTIGCDKKTQPRSRVFRVSDLTMDFIPWSCKPLLGTRNMRIRLNKHRHPKQINCAFVSPNVWLSALSPKKKHHWIYQSYLLIPDQACKHPTQLFRFLHFSGDTEIFWVLPFLFYSKRRTL